MAKKFYKCAKCGNIISKYVDSGVPVVCCGEPMMELVANSPTLPVRSMCRLWK